MKCINCGIEYPDNYTNCPQCAAQNPAYQQPQKGQRPPYKTAVELIREVGRHKLYLPACILMTIGAAFSLVASGIDVIMTLVTISAWLFYAQSKKNDDPYKMDLTSLKILKVVKTIEIVMCWIGIVAVAVCLPLLASVLAPANTYIFGEKTNSFFSSISGILLVLIAILFVFAMASLIVTLIQAKGIRNYYKSAIESTETQLRPKKLPKYAPILMIVTAGLGIAESLISIFSIGYISELLSSVLKNSTIPLDEYIVWGGTTAFPFLAGVLYNVAYILFALIMLDAKKLSDSSYYPNPEEAFYNKQMYYGSTPNFYAQYQPPVYQSPAQPQPPVYQPTQPQNFTTADNASSEAPKPEADAENKKNADTDTTNE